MNLSLCSNCSSSESCLYKNGHVVIECGEHISPETEHLKIQYPDVPDTESAENKLEHFKGLCGNCELRDDCQWKNDNIITFHCEHYQ